MSTIIRELRIKLGLSQANVAYYIGMPLRTLEDWEIGKSKPASYVEALIYEKLLPLTPEQVKLIKQQTPRRRNK